MPLKQLQATFVKRSKDRPSLFVVVTTGVNGVIILPILLPYSYQSNVLCLTTETDEHLY